MKKAIRITFLFFISLNLNAALFVQDYKTHGDGLITLDSTSGLEWLDLTETQGLSYNSVVSLIDTGQLAGWRYATYEEASDLYSQFGFIDQASFGYFDDDQIRTAINTLNFYMGDLYPDHISYYHGSAAITGSLYGNSTYLRTGMSGFWSENSPWSYQNLGNDYFHPTSFTTFTGSLLVRDAAVPLSPSGLYFTASFLLVYLGRAKSIVRDRLNINKRL